MAEFLGTDFQVAVQMRIRERQPWIARTPEIANGGRVLNFLAPDRTGWQRVKALAEEDRVATFTAVPLESTMAALRETFGEGWKTPHWNVFFGDAASVLAACESTISTVSLPTRWHIETVARPTDRQIDDIQHLNIATGIAPYPAYYSRGEAVPCFSTCLRDEDGTLVATASANYRYHAESRLQGHMFAGSVSVSPAYRGKGLGKLLNATVLADSHRLLNWATAIEQARPDNSPSRRMIEACGLEIDQELVTLSVIAGDEAFTR